MDKNAQQQLAQAYRATTYLGFPDDNERWQIRIGEQAPIAGPMAYVTSDNPGSQRLSPEANRRRRIGFSSELETLDAELIPATSVADDDNWPDEQGFWIRPVALDEALQIARRYDQNAIVFVDEEADTELVFC